MRRHRQGGWYRKKSFRHFDLPLPFYDAAKLVNDTARVAKHGFFPFIGFTDTKRKFRTDPHQDRALPKKLRKKIVKVKQRPLKYCAHVDGYIHSYYAFHLQRLYEAFLENERLGQCVLGYRSGLGTNINLANDAFREIHQRRDCCVIALDIEAFFDSIDHFVLKQNLKFILGVDRLSDDWMAVFQSMTKFSWIDQADIEKAIGIPWAQLPRRVCSIEDFRGILRQRGFIQQNKKNYGIPQGSPISAVLSNIYMLEFDKEVMNFVQKFGGSYRRYSDDILIICPRDEHQKILSLFNCAIVKLGKSLKINEDKTEIAFFSMINNSQTCSKMLSYLGFSFDGERKLIKSATLSRYYRRMTYRARSAKNRAKDLKSSTVFKRALYSNFSHLGRAGIYSYARRAASTFEDESPKRQLRRHMKILHRELGDEDG